MLLADLKVVFIDCQTTGVSAASSHLLEIAWAIGSARTPAPALADIRASICALPEGAELKRAITKVTGITAEDLQLARSASEIFSLIQSDLAAASPEAAVIHFGRFETPFLNRLWREAADHDFDLPILCTHTIAKKLFPDFGHKGIRALSGYFGEPLEEAKRASKHVAATIHIWQGTVTALQEQGIETHPQLQAWLAYKTKTTTQKKSYKLSGARDLDLPAQPGVYRFLGKNGKVLYVGKATSLKTRVASYFRRSRGGDARKGEMLMQAWDVQVSPVGSPLEAALLECQEIKRLQPPYNIMYRGQQKHAVFYARDFSSMAMERDAKHIYGPILYPQGLTELLALSVIESVPDLIPGIFFELTDPLILQAGFDFACEQYGWPRDIFQNPRALMIQGLKFYRQYLRDLAAEDLEDELVDDDDEDATEIEFVWTPAEVAKKVERILRHSARLWFAGRRLARLSESDIVFSSNKQRGRTWHYIKVRDGEIEVVPLSDQTVAAVPEDWHRPFAQRQGAFDAERYERLQILLQELRRCAGKGAAVQIRLAPGLWLNAAELLAP